MTPLALAALGLAIVTQNQAALRASPKESAAQQAVLWQGEVLEIRGERGDYLSVYDHRLERGGFIRATQVRATPLQPEDAPQLLAIVRFLRETPGEESLGISYAAAYLKVVPAAQITAEPFDALGSMADRLAQRASVHQSKANSTLIAAHLEVAAQFGIKFYSYEHDGKVQICYDGEMYRRVLAMNSADPSQRARAALGVTRHECVDPDLGPTARFHLDQWRAEILQGVHTENLSPVLQNRVHMRLAGVSAALAYWQTRRGENALVAANQSLDQLGAIKKSELEEQDQNDFAEAAVRVGASRLAAEPAIQRGGRLAIKLAPGEPGQTCVALLDTRRGGELLAQRCTFGTVWLTSARANNDDTALALAVQPLATWREMWVFRRAGNDWQIDVLPPGSDGPELGYIEFAGWQPDSKHLLVVRELRSAGRFRRRFESVALDSLRTERQAGTPDLIPGFGRWQDTAWRTSTVSLR
jgi:hypothetical protein